MQHRDQFFLEERRLLRKKWTDNWRDTSLSAILLGLGSVLMVFKKAHEAALATGFVASAVGLGWMGVNYAVSKGLEKEQLELDAAELGIADYIDLHRNVVTLGREEVVDVKASMAVGRKAKRTRCDGGGDTDEQKCSSSLSFARTEWARRLSARGEAAKRNR